MQNKKYISIIELLLTSSVVGALVHFIYFQLSPFIWEFNSPVALENITAWTRPYALERDGVEVYALYIATFIQLTLLIGSTYLLSLVRSGQFRLLITYTLAFLSLAYFHSMGFHPPMSDIHSNTWVTTARLAYRILAGIAIIGLLLYLVRNNSRATISIAAVILIPVCFITTGSVYLPDYGYIFAPALRFLDGARLSEIYFQYDLLLSFVAGLTLYSNSPIELLQLSGQASLYLLFFGIFIFSRKLFVNQHLSIFLLVSTVIIRIYAGEHHVLTSFQVTPLRLDLWFPLLLSVYFFGPSHYSTGVILFILTLFHRNFGIIYFAAYCQLIILIHWFKHVQPTSFKKNWYQALKRACIEFFNDYYINLILSLLALALAATLLGGNGAYRYQTIGIGFLRIAHSSFFWYVALLLTGTFALLINQRNLLSEEYFISGCFLIFLAIGNSLYFFGRSHENNIINISVVYVFILFLFIDLAIIHTSNAGRYNCAKINNAAIAGAVVVVLLICITYSNSIYNKITRQILNFSSRQFVYQNPVRNSAMDARISSIRSVISESKKVYFVSSIDYIYYIQGNYKPVGYYSPFLSWVYQNEMISFLNSLILDNYFIVIDDFDLIRETISSLAHNHAVSNGTFLILWK